MEILPFQQAAERVKATIDIVEIVGRQVSLKKRGRTYLGLCPFHNDRKPSMNVSQEKGLFKCFSCGEGGDALSFLMKLNHKSYPEVIQELAEEQGIQIEDKQRDPAAVAQALDEKQKLEKLNVASAKFYQAKLLQPEAAEAKAYLEKRLASLDQWQSLQERFQPGLAPDAWDQLAQYLTGTYDFVSAEQTILETAGLASPRKNGNGYYDRFRNRLIIPIHNLKGQVVAFGGRALTAETEPKYLNSSETPVYHKSSILYGLYQGKQAIRQHGQVVVMEGYFDVITAQLAGIEETVATCGTAMTESHLQMVLRAGAQTVYLCFDADEAGQRAADSAISLVQEALKTTLRGRSLAIRVIQIPEGKDPDDYIKAHGAQGFRHLMHHAVDGLTFRFERVLSQLPLNTTQDKTEAVRRLTPLLAGLQQPVVKAQMMTRYGQRLGFDTEVLQQQVDQYQRSTASYGSSNTSFASPSQQSALSLAPQRSNQPSYSKRNNWKKGGANKRTTHRARASIQERFNSHRLDESTADLLTLRQPLSTGLLARVKQSEQHLFSLLWLDSCFLDLFPLIQSCEFQDETLASIMAHLSETQTTPLPSTEAEQLNALSPSSTESLSLTTPHLIGPPTLSSLLAHFHDQPLAQEALVQAGFLAERFIGESGPQSVISASHKRATMLLKRHAQLLQQLRLSELNQTVKQLESSLPEPGSADQSQTELNVLELQYNLHSQLHDANQATLNSEGV